MSDEKALTVKDEQALAVAEQRLAEMMAADPALLDMWGGENLEDGDTGQPPRLKLCQEDDPGLGLKAGEYFNSLTNESYGKVVEIVPLLPLRANRIEYYTPYEKGQPPFCASDDGKMPRQSTDRRPLQDPKPGPCATCKQAKFPESGSPPCTRIRNFMVALREGEEYMLFSLAKSGIPTARRFTAMMKAAGLRKSVVFAARFCDTDKGKYYEPLATSGSKLDAAEKLHYIDVRAAVDRLVKDDRIDVTADQDNGFGGSQGDDATDDDPGEDIPF